jgi:pyruvate kinase
MRYARHEMLKRRRTKIVATVGLTTYEPQMIERLIGAGVNVFRLNLSHGDHDFHSTAHQRIREVAMRLHEPIATMIDLCGPKMRVGHFTDGRIQLETGSHVTVTTREVMGEPGLIPSQYQALADDVYPGDRILLDDGFLELEVTQIEGTEIHCQVLHGGELKDRKGLNMPGATTSALSMTDKDWEDASLAVDLGADYLALSFVRKARDVAELQEFLRQKGSTAKVIAKIEMPDALDVADEILDVSDGIMVARGDLGVELPIEQVPIAQRYLIAQARARGKPAIVATQMLESMIDHPRPTRAEVSDVSTAVFSGADAVMLSAETASGAHPIEAVEMMDRVARNAEACIWTEGAFGTIASQTKDETPPLRVQAAIARSISQLSRDLRVRAIVVRSQSGGSANVVSAARPAAPIVAATSRADSCRQMNLLWGVIPIHIHVDKENLQPAPELAVELARQLELAEEGQFVLAMEGVGDNSKTDTPIVTVTAIQA